MQCVSSRSVPTFNERVLFLENICSFGGQNTIGKKIQKLIMKIRLPSLPDLWGGGGIKKEKITKKNIHKEKKKFKTPLVPRSLLLKLF